MTRLFLPLTILLAFLAGAALATFFPVAGSGPEVRTNAPDDASSAASRNAVRVRFLETRIAELEAALRSERDNRNEAENLAEKEAEKENRDDDPSGNPPDLATLSELVKLKDGAALAREIAKLLVQGEGGYPLLFEFLEKENSPISQRILKDKGVVLALIGLAHEHPAEVAGLARYLLNETSGSEMKWLRYHLFSFLPALMNLHPGEFPELRATFEAELLAETAEGYESSDLWKTVAAMREIGFEPPVEIIEEVLFEPGKKEYHRLMIEELARREDLDASLATLLEFVGPAEELELESSSLRLAFNAIDRLQLPCAEAMIWKSLDSPLETVRDEATLAHFKRSRDVGSLHLAVNARPRSRTNYSRFLIL